jgi:excisionase family DNA binding protein
MSPDRHHHGMNTPTTRKFQSQQQVLWATPTPGNGSQRPTAGVPDDDPEQDPTTDAAGAALPAMFSGDRLVVTVAEAGELLGVSRAFAYELAARGELKTIRLGRRVLVPKVALLAMVGLAPPPQS